MRDISFFSEDRYLYIPSEANPRVILAISDAKTSKASYKLYNPFSFKARLLKKVSQFLFVNFNGLMRYMVKTKSHQKSDFITYIEHKLNLKFVVSVYNATENDKVVLQLQSNNKICGYLKFPLNKAGIENIITENKAITLLSKKNIIAPCILNDIYNDVPYIILPELEGEINTLSDLAIVNLMDQFKKEKTSKLSDHPRVVDLYEGLYTWRLESYKIILDKIVENSTARYYEVFEHGDFAPWNIIKTNEGLRLFDFEFFVENGLEYFDLIKYHFQVGRLLKKKTFSELFDYLCDKINITEINYMVSLFLIKEIIVLKKMNKDYQFHDNMLNHICG